MSDFILIFIVLVVVSVLIYALYIIVLGPSRGSQEDLQISSNDLLTQLNVLYRQKKYHIVECMAKKYLEKKRADCDIRSILTKSLYENGKMFEAIDHAKIILRYQPTNADIKLLLAKFYEATLKPMQAATVLKEIVNEDPQNIDAIRELAQIYMSTNQKNSAIKLYKDLSELVQGNHEKVSIKAKVAEMHIEAKDYELAIEEYRANLEIYPADIDTMKKLLNLYKLTNDWTLAVEIANEIFEMHSSEANDLYALENLAESYAKVNDYERAMECAILVKDHPLANGVSASKSIAQILFETDKLEQSSDLLTQLVAENPEDMELKKSLALSLQAQKDFYGATEIYNKILDCVGANEILQVHFEMSNLFSDWAMHLFETNDTAECFKKFTMALQYDSDNPQIYFKLGLINQKIKNYNEAVTQFKKAIERAPDNSLFYSAIAECYKALDNVFEEKKALLECIKYDVKNPKAHYELALIYKKHKEFDNAIGEIQKAIELDSHFSDAKYLLAIMLEIKGKRDEAVQVYEQILKINPEHQGAANNLKMLKG